MYLYYTANNQVFTKKLFLFFCDTVQILNLRLQSMAQTGLALPGGRPEEDLLHGGQKILARL